MKKNRLCITPQDISNILKISERQALRKFQEVKDAYGKEKHHYLTFKEFAHYIDIPLEDIYEHCSP